MTMRELTDEERDKTDKGIERLATEIVELEESMKFNEKTIEFQKAQAEYQDYIRPYLKNKKEIEDKKTMGLMRQDLALKEATIKELYDHIENGVTIKNGGD